MGLAWPGDLPPYAETWTEQAEPVTVRTEMDIGPPKVRRRYTRHLRQIQVTMVGTHAAAMALKSFFEVNLQGGVLFHNFAHPFTGVVGEYRMVEAPAIGNISSLGTTINMTWEQL